MPFDGIVLKSVIEELNIKLSGGKIEKIFQTEKDEVLLSIRNKGENFKLLLSANSKYPRIHLTNFSKENPTVPSGFCMLLRKHIGRGKIIRFNFFDYERIVSIDIESVNELGDTSCKKIMLEIMGKHSNIILLNNNNVILDSVKHIDASISSVREIMPARTYTLPPSQNKVSPSKIDVKKLLSNVDKQSNITVGKFLLSNICGFSPLIVNEVCFIADIDINSQIGTLSTPSLEKLDTALCSMIKKIETCEYNPCVIFEDAKFLSSPIDFHVLNISQYTNLKSFNSITDALIEFYTTKSIRDELKNKKSDIYKVLKNNIDRCNKKLSIYQKKLKDGEKKDKYKLYGDLIISNIYCMPKEATSVELLNFYETENPTYIEVPLDNNLSPQKNAQRYFKLYDKAKNALLHANEQIKETELELNYLENVLHMLDSCSTNQEILEIKEELIKEQYIKHRIKKGIKKNSAPSQPLRYKSTDGYDILVGKNNLQNEQLTLKTASSKDIWLHIKDAPGSHVIIKKQQEDIPTRTLEEAAMIAAFHSKAKMSSNVQIDYTTIKNVKKIPGAKPGMVRYVNYKTIVVTPCEETIDNLKN